MRAAVASYLLPVAATAVVLSGCAVGPDYRKPATAAPAAFAETGPWKTAAPRDQLPRGAWWSVYRDAELDRLEDLAAKASPTLAAAVARRDQARAAADIGRAGLFPRISLDPSASRSRTPPIERTNTPAHTDNAVRLPLDLSYEIDLWGRVRRTAEAADARAAAGEADYHSVMLGVQSDVARLHFTQRALAAEKAILERTVATRRESVEILTRRFELGAGTDLAVQLARTELATTEGDLFALNQDINASRNALAVLTGQMPEGFALNVSAAPLPAAPEVPVGVPSDLLERRPDIASAERNLAAANAGIGVARAAFFPSITLGAAVGYQSSAIDNLTRGDNRFWSIGPGINLPLFSGGSLTANQRRAEAAHAEALAVYRQTVLNAFREVETALSDLRLLADRDGAQDRARESSARAAALVRQRYDGGQIGYLDVADSERTALLNERRLVQIRGQSLLASVTLIKALGGGW